MIVYNNTIYVDIIANVHRGVNSKIKQKDPYGSFCYWEK